MKFQSPGNQENAKYLNLTKLGLNSLSSILMVKLNDKTLNYFDKIEAS